MADVSLGRRILRSLASLAVGWVSAMMAYVVALAVRGQITDVGAVAAWTLAFAFVGWVAVGIPLVWFIDARSRVFQSWWGMFAGAAVAVLAFWLLAGRWFVPGTVEFNLFAGFAATIGGVAWRAYAFLGRGRVLPISRSEQ